MSNSFGVLSSASGSDSSDGSAEEEDQTPRHSLSSLHLRLHEAEHLLAQRSLEAVLQALIIFEEVSRAECGPEDVGALIRCHAHSGSAHMLLALLDCRKEEYGQALLRYEAAIADMRSAAMAPLPRLTCLTRPRRSAPRSRPARLSGALDRLVAARAISMDLEHVTRLRDDLMLAQQRKQAAFDRSCQARDVVKQQMGDNQWRALRGNSDYATKRNALQQSLRAIQVVLQKIDDTAMEREQLRQFGEQQRAARRESRARRTTQRRGTTERKLWQPVVRHKQQ